MESYNATAWGSIADAVWKKIVIFSAAFLCVYYSNQRCNKVCYCYSLTITENIMYLLIVNNLHIPLLNLVSLLNSTPHAKFKKKSLLDEDFIMSVITECNLHFACSWVWLKCMLKLHLGFRHTRQVLLRYFGTQLLFLWFQFWAELICIDNWQIQRESGLKYFIVFFSFPHWHEAIELTNYSFSIRILQ